MGERLGQRGVPVHTAATDHEITEVGMTYKELMDQVKGLGLPWSVTVAIEDEWGKSWSHTTYFGGGCSDGRFMDEVRYQAAKSAEVCMKQRAVDSCKPRREWFGE